LDVLGSKSLACLGLFILLADYIYRFCRCVFFILAVAGLMANQDWAEVLKQAAVPETLASAVATVYANADVFRYAFKTENVLDQFTKKKLVELKFVASPECAEAECHPGLGALRALWTKLCLPAVSAPLLTANASDMPQQAALVSLSASGRLHCGEREQLRKQFLDVFG
jgi:hypothetical protein